MMDDIVDEHKNMKAQRSAGQSFQVKEGGKAYNIGYILALFMCMSIGTIQFGYSIGSWNTGQAPFEKVHNWTDDVSTNYQTYVQSFQTGGSAVGALFAGPFAKYGRWKCIFLTNIFVLLGSAICVVADQMSDRTTSLILLIIGRFIFGLACGSFSVFCPKYISETSPVEIKGPTGFMSQINICFGILLPFLIGNFFDLDKVNECKTLLWILWLLPVGLSALQMLLMVTLYTYETPPVLKQRGEDVVLREMMSKIYRADQIQSRIDEIGGDDAGEGHLEQIETDVGYIKSFTDPQYARASFVGCALAMFQQATGINFLMFYSNTIFQGAIKGISANTITFIVGGVNFGTSLMGLPLIGMYGRKTLMKVFNLAMAIDLILVGYFSLNDYGIEMLICLMFFLAFFEFSSGPIVWLYMSEIMTDKAQSVATVLNWGMNLVISIICPILVDAIGLDNVGYIFITTGCLTLIGTLFIVVFMKETRGKTQAEIEQLFYTENNKQFSKKKVEDGLLQQESGRTSYGN